LTGYTTDPTTNAVFTATGTTFTDAVAANSWLGTAGNDTFTMGTNLTTNDTINGGLGTDTLTATALAVNGLDSVTNVEIITLTNGGAAATYTTLQQLVAAGATLTVNGSGATAAITWDGKAETDGFFSITGGTGADVITGGSLADTITGGAAADTIAGGQGLDIIDLGVGDAAIDVVVIGNLVVAGIVGTDITAANNGADTITSFTLGAGGDQLMFDISALGLAGGTEYVGAIGVLTIESSEEVVVLTVAGYATDALAEAAVNNRVTTNGLDMVYAYYNTADNTGHVVHTTDAGAGGTVTLLGVVTSTTTQALFDTLHADNINSV
jgi:hypothetical protein